ncbi:unnamed protein product [Spirodela intermedia]|uniref:Uncharacterized protein n=1 Tax=Spirodela intermedia TaxID=51605 RepID=A0A7I8LF67_SPIIN|nr:unnamed protein product [Spirodela intermedia]
MSGAQGAQPMGSPTATTYESVEGGENRTAMGLKSREDEGGIQVEKEEDKAQQPTGEGGPVFGEGEEENKQDLGVTGTG